MSAGDTLNDKRKRRRELRRQAAEAAPVDGIEEVDEELDEEEDDEDSSGRGLSERKGRPTPGRRTQEVEAAKDEGNAVTRPIRGLGDYVQGVRAEIQKVVWPTREETRRLTTIVLIVMVLASLTLGAISLLFQAVVAWGIATPLVFLVVGLIVVGIFVWYLRQSNRRIGGF